MECLPFKATKRTKLNSKITEAVKYGTLEIALNSTKIETKARMRHFIICVPLRAYINKKQCDYKCNMLSPFLSEQVCVLQCL